MPEFPQPVSDPPKISEPKDVPFGELSSFS